MPYLSEVALRDLGFRKIGQNVKISDKAAIYDAHRMEIGDNSRIDDFCVISGSLTLGKHVFIGAHCLVAGGEPGIEMEDFSTLAYSVQVFSQSDDYSGRTMTNPTVPREFKQELKAAVRLGRHVIVGAGSVVFPGVDLAQGCSVGAMSLVNRSTQPWGIYAGSPARRLRERSQDLLALEQRFLGTRE